MKILMWLSIGLDRRTPSEHLFDAIVEQLYKEGHTVHILQKNTYGDRPALTGLMSELGVTTRCIKLNQSKKNSFVNRYLNDLIYVHKCREYIKNSDADRVFLQSSNVAGYQMRYLKKYLANIPVTFNVQDIFPENAGYTNKIKFGSFVYNFFAKWQHKAYEQSTNIITISEDMKDEIVSTGINKDKIHVIYNWSYQDDVYYPEKMNSETVNQILKDGYFNVVYAGNIGLMQNVDIVVKAAELLKENAKIKFHIIGNGLYRNNLEKYAEDHEINNVEFHDMLDSRFAPYIYCKADVNIIPLAENIYKTALPSKTATCLAAQKPIIFAIGKNSKISDLIDKKRGFSLVDSDDTNDLSNQIINLFQMNKIEVNPELYLSKFQKSKNSKKYVQLICRN